MKAYLKMDKKHKKESTHMWMGLNIKADGHTMKETVKVSCNMRTAMNIMANG